MTVRVLAIFLTLLLASAASPPNSSPFKFITGAA